MIAGGLLPWTLFAIAPLAGVLVDAAKRRLAPSREERRLWVWALAPTLLFMASVGQQPRYVLPVLPPLAILLAAAIDRAAVRAASQPGLADLGHGRAVSPARSACCCGCGRCSITVEPWAPVVAALALAAAALVLAAVAATGRWQALPAATAGAAAVALLAVQFGALAGRRPEPVEQMAHAVLDQRAGVRAGRTVPCLRAQPGLLLAAASGRPVRRGLRGALSPVARTRAPGRQARRLDDAGASRRRHHARARPCHVSEHGKPSPADRC